MDDDGPATYYKPPVVKMRITTIPVFKMDDHYHDNGNAFIPEK